MDRKIYVKPEISLTQVNTECSIAAASVQIGNDGKFTPDIEDFIIDETTITGFGDI